MKYFNRLFVLVCIVGLSCPLKAMEGPGKDEDSDSKNSIVRFSQSSPIEQQEEKVLSSRQVIFMMIQDVLPYAQSLMEGIRTLSVYSYKMTNNCISYLLEKPKPSVAPQHLLTAVLENPYLLEMIFKKLSIQDLGVVAQVSKSWKNLSENNSIWRTHLDTFGATRERVWESYHGYYKGIIEIDKKSADRRLSRFYELSDNEQDLAQNLKISYRELSKIKQVCPNVFIRDLSKEEKNIAATIGVLPSDLWKFKMLFPAKKITSDYVKELKGSKWNYETPILVNGKVVDRYSAKLFY